MYNPNIDDNNNARLYNNNARLYNKYGDIKTDTIKKGLTVSNPYTGKCIGMTFQQLYSYLEEKMKNKFFILKTQR